MAAIFHLLVLRVAAAVTVPLLETARTSVFPLDVVDVEVPRVGWHQAALECAGGQTLLGLVDVDLAEGARGVLCECRAVRGPTSDVQRVRAVAVGRFEVEKLRITRHPGRLAVGDVCAVVDAAPEDDDVLREHHDLLERRGVQAADELRAHLAYETVALMEGWAGSTATAQAGGRIRGGAPRDGRGRAPLCPRRPRGGRVRRGHVRGRLRGVRAGAGLSARGFV